MIEGCGFFLGVAFVTIVFLLCLFVPNIFEKYKKCDKCGKRGNKRHIHGQYNCSWYECKCEV